MKFAKQVKGKSRPDDDVPPGREDFHLKDDGFITFQGWKIGKIEDGDVLFNPMQFYYATRDLPSAKVKQMLSLLHTLRSSDGGRAQ